MPEFSPGEGKTAIVPMTNPTVKAFDYSVELYMGTDLAVMARKDFHLESKETKDISLSVTMPSVSGTYPVNIGVFSGGVFIPPVYQGEDVIITAPLPFTFSNVSAKKVTFYALPGYNTIVFHCTVTNPNNASVTKTLKLMRGGAIYGEVARGRITLTLAPGRSYSYSYDGNTRDPVSGYYYGPYIIGSGTHYFWLEDLDGNKSAKKYV